MTQLYIGGEEVALPSDLNVDLKICNPLITKEGTVSYDIDLDLRDPRNARIYSHIGRLNSKASPGGRRAVLICGGHTIVDGKEILLSLDGNTAKIQLVGGNSEFNNDIGGLTMRDLDLGEIPVSEGQEYVTESEAFATLSACYPTYKHVFTPVLIQYYRHPFMDTRRNRNFGFFRNAMKYGQPASPQPSYYKNTVLAPQPYLLHIVRKVIEAMGYTVDFSTLESDETNRRLYILNRQHTLKYNRMVPNWTVDKFIDEVEKFFNVVVSVNNFDKKVSVVHQRTYYTSAGRHYIADEDVIDLFEREFDVDDNDIANQYDNVKYNFPATDWYKYAALDDDLLESIPNAPDQSDAYEGTKYVSKVYHDSSTARKGTFNELCLYFNSPVTPTTYGLKYAISMTVSAMSGDLYYPQLVDHFHPVENNGSGNSTTLNIIPAEVFGLFAWSWEYPWSPRIFLTTAPYCREPSSPKSCITAVEGDEEEAEEAEDTRKDGTTEENGLNQYILGGMSSEAVSDQMFVAFYTGMNEMQKQLAAEEVAYYPQSLVYPVVTFANARRTGDAYGYDYRLAQAKYDTKYDLSPAYRKERYYDPGVTFDSSQEFTIRFRTSEVLDPTKVFVIRSRAFYCKEIKYTIKATGFDPIVEGVFFAVD